MKFKSTRYVKNKVWLIWGEIGAALLGIRGVFVVAFQMSTGQIYVCRIFISYQTKSGL